MTDSPSLGHTLSLSARLASLEADVAELNEWRRQRAELDLRIAGGERAERLLTEAETILLQLLNREAQPSAPVGAEALAEDGEPKSEEVQAEEPRALAVQEPDPQDSPPADPEQTPDTDDEDSESYRNSMTITAEWVWAQALTHEFGAVDVASSTGVKESTVKIYLRQMEKDGEIERLAVKPGYALRFRRVAKAQAAPEQTVPLATPAAHSEATGLLPIPPRLSTDECSLFDALRRAPDGMSARLLCARLNWNSNRVAQALERLQAHGHVSCALGVFQVMGYVGRHEEHVCALAEDLRDNGAAD